MDHLQMLINLIYLKEDISPELCKNAEKEYKRLKRYIDHQSKKLEQNRFDIASMKNKLEKYEKENIELRRESDYQNSRNLFDRLFPRKVY